MSALVFADPHQPPTGASVTDALGPAADAWHALFATLRAQHPDLVATWSYFADGKSWLLKVTRKAKTVCWVAVEPGLFRVAFYFAERLTPALLDSDLSEPCKAAIRARPALGKLRPVTVEFGPPQGLDDVVRLVGLKGRLK